MYRIKITLFGFLTVALLCGPLLSLAQGKFWGMTTQGGTHNLGTLFSMNADGTGTTVLYSFQSGASGNSPLGGVTSSGGLLYGVTNLGGANGDGVIFSYDTLAGIYTDVYDFDNTHGASPTMEPTAGYSDGKLYGITPSGGANGGGVIYSFDPGSNTFSKLYDMPASSTSNTALTLFNHKFYGLTQGGGAGGGQDGMFFSFDPATNTFTDLYDYPGEVYVQPPGQMAIYNNVLYGVDGYNNGDLFSYSEASGFNTLVVFASGNSTFYYPTGVVVANNVLYGMCIFGGPDFTPGLFAYDPATATYSEPLYLSYADGGPDNGNITAYNNKLFGIGFNNLYQIDLSTFDYTDLEDFSSLHPSPFYGNNAALYMVSGPGAVGTTPQTITFSDIQKAYGDPDFNPGATASSQLRVSYTSSDPTVATVLGTNIHIVGAGTCAITASQGGNIIYDSATSVTVTLTVSPAPLVIGVVDTLKNQLQPNPVFRITYSGFVYSDGPSSLLTPPVATTTATTSSSQGTYPITVSGAVSDNYAITYQGGTLTIIGEYQSIAATDITKAYGDADFDPGATATSGLPVTYTSGNLSVATVNADGTLHITGIGTDTITVTQPGDATWAPTSLQVLLTVNKAPLTIIVDNKSKAFGQPDPVFTAEFNGLVYSDDPANIGAVFSSTDSGIDAHPGDYLINVQLGEAAASHYNIVSYSTGILVITPGGGASQNSLNAWFSNPGTLQVGIWMTAGQSAALQIYDLGGRQLLTQQVSLLQGYNGFMLPAGWASGVYIVRLVGEGLSLDQKIRKIN